MSMMDTAIAVFDVLLSRETIEASQVIHQPDGKLAVIIPGNITITATPKGEAYSYIAEMRRRHRSATRRERTRRRTTPFFPTDRGHFEVSEVEAVELLCSAYAMEPEPVIAFLRNAGGNIPKAGCDMYDALERESEEGKRKTREALEQEQKKATEGDAAQISATHCCRCCTEGTSIPVQREYAEEGGATCKICCETVAIGGSRPIVTAVPCGHMICNRCSAEIVARATSHPCCPFCKNVVQLFVKNIF